MFYSHDLLTSPTGGLATVWLLATLGTESKSKKVNRKAILDVDVPKACDTIINPQAPIALRLQSNLLYGVSRVYWKQYAYMLSDAQTAQASMRNLVRAVRKSDLDPQAGLVRPEHLMVADDPNFLPDFSIAQFTEKALALDFSFPGSERQSSLYSGGSHGYPTHPIDFAFELPSLEVPSLSGGIFSQSDVDLDPDRSLSASAVAQRTDRLNRLLDDDDMMILDPGFSFDADGNFVDDLGSSRKRAASVGSDNLGFDRIKIPKLETNVPLSSHEPNFFGDDLVLPDAEPFPPNQNLLSQVSNKLRQNESENERSPSEYVAGRARERRTRARRPLSLTMDTDLELDNRDLRQWKTDYLSNMAIASVAIKSRQISRKAKTHAKEWIFQPIMMRTLHLPNKCPLKELFGINLIESLVDDQSDVEEKSRMRPVEDDTERRAEFIDDYVPHMDQDETLELGRDATDLLGDDPTFPWNTSGSGLGSRQGSSLGVGRGGSVSLGGYSSLAGGGPGSSLRSSAIKVTRTNRLASGSPITSQGIEQLQAMFRPSRNIASERDVGDAESIAIAAELDNQFLMDMDDDTAAQYLKERMSGSQLHSLEMYRGANNFLEFVRAVGGMGDTASTSFAKLLPWQEYAPVVAAQAFVHVLSLASRSLLDVHQVQEKGLDGTFVYGDIELRVTMI